MVEGILALIVTCIVVPMVYAALFDVLNDEEKEDD